MRPPDWTSARIGFRRPEPGDVDAIFRVHSDLRTYAHRPQGVMRDRSRAVEVYDIWRRHWDAHGFGYAVLEPCDRSSGALPPVLGFAGLRWGEVLDHQVLNLYYRLDPAAWGRGLATEAASVLVAWAARQWPDVPVLARVATNNPASRRVAEQVGLAAIAETDPNDEVPHVLLLSNPW